MKRSRIFLGVTTALLAIAGVAAAKAHRSPSLTVYYYNVAKQACYTAPDPLRYTATIKTGVAQGTVLIGSTHYKLYTNSTCLTPAYFNAN